jgi:hypothetical protein
MCDDRQREERKKKVHKTSRNTQPIGPHTHTKNAQKTKDKRTRGHGLEVRVVKGVLPLVVLEKSLARRLQLVGVLQRLLELLILGGCFFGGGWIDWSDRGWGEERGAVRRRQQQQQQQQSQANATLGSCHSLPSPPPLFLFPTITAALHRPTARTSAPALAKASARLAAASSISSLSPSISLRIFCSPSGLLWVVWLLWLVGCNSVHFGGCYGWLAHCPRPSADASSAVHPVVVGGVVGVVGRL